MASMLRPATAYPAIYNIIDDLPLEAYIVTRYAADLLGVPPPPAEDFETAEMSAMVRSNQ